MKEFDGSLLFSAPIRAALCAFAISGVALDAAADGVVVVDFAQPGNYADLKNARSDGARETDATLADLRRYLEQHAAELLGPQRRLQITIKDVDRAGQVQYGVDRGRDIRLLRSSSPPRVELSFRLTDAGGAVLKSGDRRLVDLAYNAPERRTTDDPLFYEKRLLAEWLSSELRP